MSSVKTAPLNGLSHVQGDTSQPLWDLTVPALLAATATRLPDHEAAVFPQAGIRWRYGDFQREVDRLAGGLLSLEVGKGDRVGIWSPNRPEWLLTQFATARIGAILVCINPAYRLAELEYALKTVECRTLVAAPSFKSSSYFDMLADLAPELARARPGALKAARLPDLKEVVAMGADIPDGMISFDALLSSGDTLAPEMLDACTATLGPDEPINIQFTSGTTGSPKGACLTHRNIVNNARFVTDKMAFTESDRLCIPVPFYHCFGMVMGTLGCVTKGATMVVPGEGFDAGETLHAISAERCTALFGVPTMFVAELQHPDFGTYDLSSLRTGIMAGAPCPAEIMRRVQSSMHMHGVTIAYGMTETSPVSFQSAPDDPLEARVATVGRIHPHVEVKVVDKAGLTVPTNQQGELLTRGYSVMRGYWNEPQKTSDSIDADGWMHTGDLAIMDAKGYVAITGRLKDMILRGGENIYPREIEEFLYTHPDIAVAQVFGIPDARYGETVCAFVVLHAQRTLSEQDLQDFCHGQIAHFKIPKHFRIRDEVPMTVTGKPQKFVMRDQMLMELTLV
ncbi:MAG: AMP-binding protein [Pseudomonadota bacterium]